MGRGLLAAALAGVAIAVAAPGALAATIYVNDDGIPVLPAGCAIPAAATIAGGVALAAPGDTVFVCRGTYTESVNVNKSITVRGQIIAPDLGSCDATRTAVDPNSRVRVNWAGPAAYVFLLNADNVELRNFIIQNNTLGPGIQTAAGFSGYTILQNLIQDNVLGIYLNSNGVNQTKVTTNCIRENNSPGAANGNASYSDQGFSNGLFQANRLFGHDEGGISFHLFPANDVTIQGNIGSDNSSFVEVRGGGTNIDVSANIHKNALIRDLLFDGSVTDSKIKGNIFKDSVEYGLQFRDSFAGFSNSNLLIESNIVKNTGSTAFQVDVDGLDTSTVRGNIGKSLGTFAPNEPFCDPDGSCGLLLRGGNLGNTFAGNIFEGTGWGCRAPAPTTVTGNIWTANIGKPKNTPGTCIP